MNSIKTLVRLLILEGVNWPLYGDFDIHLYVIGQDLASKICSFQIQSRRKMSLASMIPLCNTNDQRENMGIENQARASAGQPFPA